MVQRKTNTKALSQEEWKAQYSDVPQITKDLWNVELDLMEYFAKVCKKYNLRWYVDGGTLLGAVRHQGFIPWDDDIDIIMPLDDYMTLTSLKDEFAWPYFLQTWETEDGFDPFMTKIRRSDTTGYNRFEGSGIKKWNKGISIDIFALVYIPDNRFVEILQYALLKCIRAIYRGYEALRDDRQTANSKVLTSFLRGLYKLISPVADYKVLSRAYINIACWQKKKASKCGPVMFVPGKKEFIWPSKWYEKTSILSFMHLNVPCPAEWDQRLKKQYGDYLIPRREPTKHGSLIFDPYNSYLSE